MDYLELLKSIVNALDLTKLNEYSQNTRIMVWAYNKIKDFREVQAELLTKVQDFEELTKRQNKNIATLLQTRDDCEKMNDKLTMKVLKFEDKVTDLDELVSRQTNKIENDRLDLVHLGTLNERKDSKIDDLEREVAEYELIQEDNKRFFKYIVVISVFAGFMMGLLAYPLI
jgi:chromosome segregation ATPase